MCHQEEEARCKEVDESEPEAWPICMLESHGFSILRVTKPHISFSRPTLPVFAVCQMVIHNSYRLHEGIGYHRANKADAALFHILAQGYGNI